MLPDITMIVRGIENDDPITIYPLADVHLGAVEHMEKEFAEFVGRIKDEPNAYVIIGGDMMDNITRQSVGDIYTAVMRPADQKKLMAKMLEPIRDRILCGVQGNHEARSGKDADSDPLYDVFSKLDIEDRYRPNMAFLTIRTRYYEGRERKNGPNRPTYTLVVTHGSGGGALTGGVVNKAERFGYVIDGADILIIGHSHKPFVTTPTKLKIDPINGLVTQKPFHVLSCSSWLEYGGYAMRKMLNPSGHVPQKIVLYQKHREIKIITG